MMVNFFYQNLTRTTYRKKIQFWFIFLLNFDRKLKFENQKIKLKKLKLNAGNN